MSLSYMTYIGPFVECDVAKVTRNRKVMRCVRQDGLCRSIASTNAFCASCGNAIAEVLVAEQHDAINASEVSCDRLKEALTPPASNGSLKTSGKHYYLPNVDRNGHEYFRFNPKQESFVKVVDMNDRSVEVRPSQQMDLFNEDFRNEIFILFGIYGSGKVRIVWGVVNCIW